MNTQIKSIDESPTTAFTMPDLPRLGQTPSEELSCGLYSILAVSSGGEWHPILGHCNGGRTDGFFEGLLVGDEA